MTGYIVKIDGEVKCGFLNKKDAVKYLEYYVKGMRNYPGYNPNMLQEKVSKRGTCTEFLLCEKVLHKMEALPFNFYMGENDIPEEVQYIEDLKKIRG